MSKLVSAFAAALPALLLAACSSPQQAADENGTGNAESGAPENAGAPEPIQPATPVNTAVDPVPPPDAVSHPEGYLPPAPGEPGAPAVNSSRPDTTPPATEDQYIRNQTGR